MRQIDSKDNGDYRKLLALQMPAAARKHGLMVVEGVKQVADLLESDFQLDLIFFSDDPKGLQALEVLSSSKAFREVREAGDRAVLLASHLFKKASGQKTPQGVMALVAFPPRQLDAYLAGLDPASDSDLLLLLEDIQDPGNVGTLIRTANAFACQGVILMPTSASLVNPKTLAASMGSVFHLPVFEIAGEAASAYGALRQAGFRLIAASLDGGSIQHPLVLKGRRVLMLGNEGHGLSEEALRLADKRVRIPMGGQANSLNVAAAGAILLWEMAGRMRGAGRQAE